MVQHLIEEETMYNILKNISGDVMILIRARMDDAETPQVIYDGGEHALLYRSQHNTVVLGYVHPDIRSDLLHVSSVLIVEAQGNSIVREYHAKLKTMSKIPLPEKYQTAV